MTNTQLRGPGVDIKQTTEVKCDKCGNVTFNQGVFLRKVSALVNPEGRDAYLPVPTFIFVVLFEPRKILLLPVVTPFPAYKPIMVLSDPVDKLLPAPPPLPVLLLPVVKVGNTSEP